jgi:hypothetical protein
MNKQLNLPRGLRAALGLVGLASLIVAFVRTLDEAEGPVFPRWHQLVLAGALVLLGLIFAGRSWVSLLGNPDRAHDIARGFYLAQAAKYIPGVLWQPATQIASVNRVTRMGLARASGSTLVHMVVQLTSAATLGSGMAFAEHLPAWLRATAATGLLSCALLRREWMILGLRVVGRVLRLPISDSAIPSQASITRSYLWSLGTILAGGAALSSLMSGLELPPVPFRIFAFGLAWTAGFLAVPFPSGIGVREGVLIVMLATPASQAGIIAASVAHRMVTILAEVTAILISTVKRKGRPFQVCQLIS